MSITIALAPHVESGSVPGLVALVASGPEIDEVVVIGHPTIDDPAPLQRDAIFRIASLTKPLVAALAMLLVDDGRLSLDERADRWLPEIAEQRVLRSMGSALDDTVALDRPVTVEALLSFRLGFGFDPAMPFPGNLPIQIAEAELQLGVIGPPWPPAPFGCDEWLRRFASLPLIAQPGATWMYNAGTQVLGVLLERLAGSDLPTLIARRLLDPLGMLDTGFHVPAASLHRLTTAYEPDAGTEELRVVDRGDASSWWATPPQLPDGSGGMVSTLDDFWAFARLMATGGVLDGEPFLSPRSFELLTTDRLTADQRAASTMLLDGGGWGLGMAAPVVRTPGHAGGFGWDGGTGTTWRTNPLTGRTGILFTQRMMTSPQPPPVFNDFWAAAG